MNATNFVMERSCPGWVDKPNLGGLSFSLIDQTSMNVLHVRVQNHEPYAVVSQAGNWGCAYFVQLMLGCCFISICDPQWSCLDVT